MLDVLPGTFMYTALGKKRGRIKGRDSYRSTALDVHTESSCTFNIMHAQREREPSRNQNQGRDLFVASFGRRRIVCVAFYCFAQAFETRAHFLPTENRIEISQKFSKRCTKFLPRTFSSSVDLHFIYFSTSKTFLVPFSLPFFHPIILIIIR